jgi:hypothetical protein
MRKNHLFNLLIAIALAILVALTVQEAAATADIIPRADSAKGAKASECASLPSPYSLHTEYVEEMGMIVTYTEDGPTGVDGGLMYLLSAYQTCSR